MVLDLLQQKYQHQDRHRDQIGQLSDDGDVRDGVCDACVEQEMLVYQAIRMLG